MTRTTSYAASKLAVSIRRQIALSVRRWKGGVNVCYLSEAATYTLPPEIEDLSPKVERTVQNFSTEPLGIYELRLHTIELLKDA